MTILLPRLAGPAAERLLDLILSDGGFAWAGFDAFNLPGETGYGSSGGSTIDAVLLREFRDGLVDLARNHGFGADTAKEQQTAFDAALAAWLTGQPVLCSGEALRDDVWSFIGVVMAPDVVHWRFGASRRRFLGGVRNAFQRLWLRARILDRGAEWEDRWGLLDELTEDALVQITERPSIGADPVLARELAEAWVRAARRFGRGRMEPIMRQATLRLRIANEIRSLSLLPHTELRSVLDDFFDRASVDARPMLTDVTRAKGQETTSSLASLPRASEAEDRSSSTRRRSWAIWRAR